MRSGTEVIDISSSSDEDASPLSRPSRKRPFHLITTDFSETDYSEDDYDDEDNDSEVIQGPLCKKKLKDGRKFENSDDDDCIILDSDPEKTDIILSPHISASLELLITAERGHVACRDYPHPRHLCAKFSFRSTLPHKHCKMCHCYVCDVPAPCSSWNSHCLASDKEHSWRYLRQSHRTKQVPKI